MREQHSKLLSDANVMQWKNKRTDIQQKRQKSASEREMSKKFASTILLHSAIWNEMLRLVFAFFLVFLLSLVKTSRIYKELREKTYSEPYKWDARKR